MKFGYDIMNIYRMIVNLFFTQLHYFEESCRGD